MPTPNIILSGLGSIGGMALDSTHVYWSNGTASTINRALLDGTGSTVLYTNVAFAMEGIAVDGTNIYWITGQGDVFQMPKAGGTVTSLFGGAVGAIVPKIAIDSSYVYWANANSSSFSPPGTIYRTPIGGGPVTDIVTNLNFVSNLTVDGTNVYWTTLDLNTGRRGSIPTIKRWLRHYHDPSRSPVFPGGPAPRCGQRVLDSFYG